MTTETLPVCLACSNADCIMLLQIEREVHELRGDDENGGHESGTESDKDAREAQVSLC